MPRDVQGYRTDAMDWVERMQTLATESEPVISDESVAFLRAGLQLARKVQNYIMQTFHYHSVLLKPISRAVLQSLGTLLEILMVLRGCVERFGLAVSQLTDRMKLLILSRIQMTCYTLEKRLAADKRGNFSSAEQVDSLTALKVCFYYESSALLSIVWNVVDSLWIYDQLSRILLINRSIDWLIDWVF